MEKSNSGNSDHYAVFDCIRHIVKRVNSGLTNPLLLQAGRIELLKSWRQESPYWLYTQPGLVFDSSIQAFGDFEAFAEEIKSNRRQKDGENRQDYFHELKQFYNGDLKVLSQNIITQIDEVNTEIEKISKSEPDQYAAGRPIMGVTDGNGPKARQQVFELYKNEIDTWRNTPQGQAIELTYQNWKKSLNQLNDYRSLLLKVQNDVNEIINKIVNAIPSMEKHQFNPHKSEEDPIGSKKDDMPKGGLNDTSKYQSFSDLFKRPIDIQPCIDVLNNYEKGRNRKREFKPSVVVAWTDHLHDIKKIHTNEPNLLAPVLFNEFEGLTIGRRTYYDHPKIYTEAKNHFTINIPHNPHGCG